MIFCPKPNRRMMGRHSTAKLPLLNDISNSTWMNSIDPMLDISLWWDAKKPLGYRCEGGSQKVAFKQKLALLLIIPPLHETMALPLAMLGPYMAPCSQPALPSSTPAASYASIDPSDGIAGLTTALRAANTAYGADPFTDDNGGNGWMFIHSSIVC